MNFIRKGPFSVLSACVLELNSILEGVLVPKSPENDQEGINYALPSLNIRIISPVRE